VTLPEGWTSRLDEELNLLYTTERAASIRRDSIVNQTENVFYSPGHAASIRVGPGIVSPHREASDFGVRAAFRAAGIADEPVPVRVGRFTGRAGGFVTDQGRRHHLWILQSGRLSLVIELRSISAQYDVAFAGAILETLTVNHAAISTIPIRYELPERAGVVVGTIWGYAWRYWWALVLLAAIGALIIYDGRTP
jgi:hypothetical protein